VVLQARRARTVRVRRVSAAPVGAGAGCRAGRPPRQAPTHLVVSLRLQHTDSESRRSPAAAACTD
jgi:hypothetical protein